jgi:rhomboid protease GluP
MSAPTPSPPPDPFPEGTADAGVYATHDEGFQHSLVVLAIGKDCWLVPADDGHHLRVNAYELAPVLQQLTCFDRERLGWPPRLFVDAVPVIKRMPISPLIWVLVVFAVFWLQERRAGFTDTGLLDARRVSEHAEWWRAASALWLHKDIGHLVSNAGSGLLVFSAVVFTFGLRKGWGLLAISAISGNLAAVWIHFGSDYRSLGASTAIFAGLGLLTGRAVRVMSQSGHPHRWRTMIVPLLAGLAVLALFGAGGVNIDILAHATGFASGLGIGFLVPGVSRRPASVTPSSDKS